MATIRVDYENNAEAWWDAARELSASLAYPDFTRVMNALELSDDDIELPCHVVESFLSRARRLPGWDEGSRLAPKYPVVFDLDP